MERALSHPSQVSSISKRKRGRRGRGRTKKKKSGLNDGIFNLAGVEFSEPELEVLQQGLKFAPEKNIDKFEIFIDVEKYIRKLNIKKYFAGKSTMNEGIKEDPVYQHSGLKNNSTFNPKKGMNHQIEAFKTMVQEDVRELSVPTCI